MTAAKFMLEVYVNLNIILFFTLLIWLGIRLIVSKGALRQAYSVHLSILKTLLLLAVLSPLLAIAVTKTLDILSPGHSVVLSDMVVAAYLRGDIAMDAVRFEAILNTRNLWTERLFAMDTALFVGFAAVLVSGFAYYVIRFIRAALNVRQMLSDSYLWKRVGPVDIRLSDTISVPLATRGMLRRHVVLPADPVTSSSDRHIAIAHELQHFRQADIEWELAFELLRPFLFWNPAFVLLKRQFDRLRELSCDQAVIARYHFKPIDYANCLLQFCVPSVAPRAPRHLNVALVASGRRSARNELANRLLSLKSAAHHYTLKQHHLIALAFVLGVATAVAGASLSSPKDWSHDRLMLSTVVNLERLEAINRGF